MKLISVLLATFALSAQAFNSNPSSLTKKVSSANKPVAFNKNKAVTSPLFRDAALTRGGAVPGWAAYNEALEKTPITAKACTSAVGFFLGDLLAQVRYILYVKKDSYISWINGFLPFYIYDYISHSLSLTLPLLSLY